MSNRHRQVCPINKCGKEFAPLPEGRILQEEDDFRMCPKHEEELSKSFAKLRGNW